MATSSANKSGVVLLKALVIIAAGLWIYWPALNGTWIWDDLRFIPDNPLMNDPARLWKIWFQPKEFIEYYPIEATVQWAQWILWGNNTLGYHLTNVVLHLTSAFLLWRLFAKLGLRCAWLGALIFTIHPIMVESVAWIVELKNTLSLPPLLLAMIVYLDYDENRRPRAYALACFLFIVAMLCKTSVMMLPFVVLLHAWWKRNRIDARDLCGAAGFLAISLVLGGINSSAAHVGPSWSGLTEKVSPLHRIFSIAWIILFYLYKTVFPLRLLPVYPEGVVPVHGVLLAIPVLLLAGILALAWTKRATWGRGLLFGLGFYLINFAPIALFILMRYPGMTWSVDHLVYLPMIGLFGLAAGAVGWIVDHSNSIAARRTAQGVAALAILIFTLLGHRQAALYVDRKTLWTYTLAHFPDATAALDDMSNIALEEGDAGKAVAYARRAAELAPDNEVGSFNLGNALLQLHRVPEARAAYANAVKIKPADAAAHAAVANCLADLGDYKGALKEANLAVRLQPNLDNAVAARGEIRRSLGDLTGALQDLDRAIALNPDRGVAYISRGVIRQFNGDSAGALDDLRRFRRLAATDPNADYAALWIWVIESEQGHSADAGRDLTAALAQGWNATPTDPVSRHALFLLGNGAEADYLAAQRNEPGAQCEARYYAGVKRRLAGDKTGAVADFRAAVASGQKDFFEYNLAQGEIKTLAP
jgi:tetratricopeptide (TPR) repeat protein